MKIEDLPKIFVTDV